MRRACSLTPYAKGEAFLQPCHFSVHQGGQSDTQQVVVLPNGKETPGVMHIHGLGTFLVSNCRPNVTRVTPCQLLCAAEVCASLSTPTWDVSVQPHGVVNNSSPSRRQASGGTRMAQCGHWTGKEQLVP